MNTGSSLTLKTRLMIAMLMIIPVSSVAFGALMLALASLGPDQERLAAPDTPLSKTSWRATQP